MNSSNACEIDISEPTWIINQVTDISKLVATQNQVFCDLLKDTYFLIYLYMVRLEITQNNV